MYGTAIVFFALLLDGLESRRSYKKQSSYKPVPATEHQGKIS